MADEKAARRNADNAGGILGSLRDALKAAGRGDVAFDDPTDRKAAERKAGERKTPAVIALAPPQPAAVQTLANVEVDKRPAPSAAEAVREAKSPPAKEGGSEVTTRLVRGSAAVPPMPARTKLVRGRAPIERGEFHQDPVVGWLVVVGGPGLGAFRPIFEGNNAMGRGRSNRIAIDFGDDSISSDEQAYIRYDSGDRAFLLVPNMAKTNVVAVNDKKPTGAVTLTAMDVITMGRTQLAFVPFCGSEFDWSEIADAKA